MKPEEERLIGVSFQPGDGMVDAVFGAALDEAEVFLEELLPGKGVVVRFEAAGESPTSIEDKRADNGAGSVTVVFETLRQSAEAVA
jgi:hypothetical protein